MPIAHFSNSSTEHSNCCALINDLTPRTACMCGVPDMSALYLPDCSLVVFHQIVTFGRGSAYNKTAKAELCSLNSSTLRCEDCQCGSRTLAMRFRDYLYHVDVPLILGQLLCSRLNHTINLSEPLWMVITSTPRRMCPLQLPII